MLEAQAHHRLKQLLRESGGSNWPHHLTLTRLVARSLRRGDHSLFPVSATADRPWLLGLLLPVLMADYPVLIVASESLQRRLIKRELASLAAVGLQRPLWQGESPPSNPGLWLVSAAELVEIWRRGELGDHQLIFAEAEELEEQLRQAQAIRLLPQHWDQLARAKPQLAHSLLHLHERLSRQLLNRPLGRRPNLAIAAEQEAPLRLLVQGIKGLPEPWQSWQQSVGPDWTSWAITEPKLLQWSLERQPLKPLASLNGLMLQRGAILIGALMPQGQRLQDLGLRKPVVVPLHTPERHEALPLYAPRLQAMPNSPFFSEQLLAQCRRLVLGQLELSVVLVNDDPLRQWLTSALAAEFGQRVDHEQTAPDSNGVVCCGWDWWLEHHEQLPQPGQLIVGLLPIASLEDPLTAARVNGLMQGGRDWFRELLLPEAIERVQRGVAPLRTGKTCRLAVLDGRLRGRGWGQRVLDALEPWEPLERLLPA